MRLIDLIRNPFSRSALLSRSGAGDGCSYDAQPDDPPDAGRLDRGERPSPTPPTIDEALDRINDYVGMVDDLVSLAEGMRTMIADVQNEIHLIDTILDINGDVSDNDLRRAIAAIRTAVNL